MGRWLRKIPEFEAKATGRLRPLCTEFERTEKSRLLGTGQGLSWTC